MSYELCRMPVYTPGWQAVCSHILNSEGYSPEYAAVKSAVYLTNAQEMNKLH
jgi:hypothetical protein